MKKQEQIRTDMIAAMKNKLYKIKFTIDRCNYKL